MGELCATFAPAYGGDSWDEATATLLGCPVEADLIRTLAAELASSGRFERPVVVDLEERCVANGMHRIVAARLTPGAPPLLVTDDLPAGDDGDCLEVFFRASRTDGASLGDDELFDDLFSRLRSFRLGDRWVEADVFASRGVELSGFWDWPWDDRGTLVAALVERAASAGVVLELLRVERFDE